MAGHHIQCTGSLPKRSSKPYIMRLSADAARPMSAPRSAARTAKRTPPGMASAESGKSGPAPSQMTRSTAAVTLAKATGTSERGRHSKSSNSTASNTAAKGAAKVADMPAAAPATSSVVRSASVSLTHCASSDPKAPPVMMIGPSAPKGPPDPMAMAAEIGLSTATRGSTRAPFSRMASMASGMPWPRILSEP